MRQDLNKVLVERERVGSSRKFKDVRRRGLKHEKATSEAWPFKGESTSPFPFKEGIMKPHKENWGDVKTFNENLNPLYGFVRKSVGKNWDKVYSELAKTFDKRGVINQHILIHLFQYVEVNTFMHKGKVYYTDQHGNKDRPIEEMGSEYFVHPVSKLLLKNHFNMKYKKAVYAQRDAEQRKTLARNLKLLSEFNNQNGTGSRWAIKINDVWYDVSAIVKPKPEKRSRVVDTETGKREYYTHYPTYDEVSLYGAKFLPACLQHQTHYAARKVTMSTSSIRKHQLNAV